MSTQNTLTTDKQGFILKENGERLKASEIKEPIQYAHVKANNSVSGNPNRCFVIYWGENQAVIDEEYCGTNWEIARHRAKLETKQVNSYHVSITEYKRHMRQNPQVLNA